MKEPMRAHHPFFFLQELKNKTILGLRNCLQLHTQRSPLRDRGAALPPGLNTWVCFTRTQDKVRAGRRNQACWLTQEFFLQVVNGAVPLAFGVCHFHILFSREDCHLASKSTS